MGDKSAIELPPLDASSLSPTMLAMLDKWEELERDHEAREEEWAKRGGVEITSEMRAHKDSLRRDLRVRAEAFMGYFERDNSSLSAEHLAFVADAVSPGWAHSSGLLVRIVKRNAWLADPLLVAAAIYHNWHGGKVGFQFLPSPSEMDASEYADEAGGLVEYIGEATGWEPQRILVGDDRAFFDSLPESFTAYRGCPGIDAERARHGICWTTSRAIAEWFARRGGGAPVLLSARVRKHEVVLVNSLEAEVVLQPRKTRVLKVRPWTDARLDAAKDADMQAASPAS